MAINGAYICDIKSDQVIEGKKTFIEEVATPALVLDHGIRFSSKESKNKSSNRVCLEASLKVEGVVEAVSFEGDGSKIQNISFENFSTNIQRSRAAFDEDLILVQQPSKPKGIFKIDTKSLFSLIPTYNGTVFNFVTNGRSIGNGCKILKDRTTSGRSVELNYRTLTFGPNLCGEEKKNEINISLAQAVTVETLDVSQRLLVPRRSKKDVQNPVSGMIIYDSRAQKFLGYAKDKWVELT